MASITTVESHICLIDQGWSETSFVLYTRLKLGTLVKTPLICFMSHRHLCSLCFADNFLYLRVENEESFNSYLRPFWHRACALPKRQRFPVRPNAADEISRKPQAGNVNDSAEL